MKVAVFDYGAGNLHSLIKALSGPEVAIEVEADPHRMLDADAVVLPGVGAFDSAAARLAPARDVVCDALLRGLPCLGICLGMQLLFERSEEGTGRGLGVIAGTVTALRTRRVPQIGWNSIDHAADPLLRAAPLTVAYYANSYVCRPADSSAVTAWSTHESDTFPAIVRRGTTVGMQFHPEKSSVAGVALLRAFLSEARDAREQSTTIAYTAGRSA